MGLKTIEIAAQANAETAAKVMTKALADAVGLTYDETNNTAWVDVNKSVGIGFVGTTGSSSGIYPCISSMNSLGIATIKSNEYAAFKTTNTYSVDIYKNDNHIAFGVRLSGKTVNIKTFAALDTNGNWNGICCVTDGHWYTVNKNVTASKRLISSGFLNADDISTSIVKLPNTYGAAIFNDIYYVLTCPVTNVNVDCVINGNTYRICGENSSSYSRLAFPID